MRPNQFSPDTVADLLRQQTVANLSDVMAALGPRVSRRTAFRKLKDLNARTSYSHRGSYYTLEELADFDQRGLWSFAGIRFSRAGTLVETAEAVVNHAEAGHFVDELDNLLHVGTQLNEVQQALFVDRHSSRSGLTTSTDLQERPLKRFTDTDYYVNALAILREAEVEEPRMDGCSVAAGLDRYRTPCESSSATSG